MIIRRYKAELAPELTLHVFDQIDDHEDSDDVEAERTTFIEVVDERKDGYEVDTVTLDDDGVKTLHKILGEIIDSRLSDGYDEAAF